MYLLSVWNLLDPLYYSLTRLTYLDGGCGKTDNIFRVRLTSYKGREVTLADGTRIRKNDLLVKIHFYNVALLKKLLPINSDLKKGKLIYTSVAASLPGLAEYVKRHPRSEEIKGVIGITHLNRGCSQLGFETVEIISRLYKCFKWCTLLPIYLLSVSEPLKTFKKNSPKYLFMAKSVLMEKYGPIR
jgi:hypothetical protein